MSHVTVHCPECRACFVVNGRGPCRCGAYLIHHAATPKVITDLDRTYLREVDGWITAREAIELAHGGAPPPDVAFHVIGRVDPPGGEYLL